MIICSISQSNCFGNAGMASTGFHLQHLSGVLDRVFTYARAEGLSEFQFAQLAEEGKDSAKGYTVADLVNRFNKQVDQALVQIKSTNESTLSDYRGVGRAGLPSTVIGLLFHAAEHTMRHVGQFSSRWSFSMSVSVLRC